MARSRPRQLRATISDHSCSADEPESSAQQPRTLRGRRPRFSGATMQPIRELMRSYARVVIAVSAYFLHGELLATAEPRSAALR